MKRPCPLCSRFDEGREATSAFDHELRAHRIKCPRCGAFLINEDMIDDNYVGDDLGLRLSGLARERTDARERRARPMPDLLHITYANEADLAASAPVPVGYMGYFDRIIQIVAEHAKHPGGRAVTTAPAIAARTYLPTGAAHGIIDQLAQEKLLEVGGTDQKMTLRLTVEGWRRAHDLGSDREGNRAFVAMWFDESMNDAYEKGLRPALVACGYQPPFRVDDGEHDEAVAKRDYTNRIDDRIIAEIRRARFIIADVTGNRSSVYYEAGFAEGLGIPIIWCCRADRMEDMAFDTRQIGHIVWKDPTELRLQLKAKIQRHGWALRR